jgi:hypothetical protein
LLVLKDIKAYAPRGSSESFFTKLEEEGIKIGEQQKKNIEGYIKCYNKE